MSNVLRAYRDKAGLSQEAVAKKLEISRQMVGHLENGDRKFTPDMAVKIEGVLGIDRADLLPRFFRKAKAA